MIDSIGSGSSVGGAPVNAVKQEESVQAVKSESSSAELSQDRVAPGSMQSGGSANSDAAVVEISPEARAALAGA